MGPRYVGVLFFAFVCSIALPLQARAELVARWQFDEGTGSTTVDSVNDITGTFIKGGAGGAAYPTWSTDKPDVAYTNSYALSFEGLQDGIQIAWPSSLNFTGTEPRSFSFWYKPTANGETAAGNYDRIMSWTSDAFEIAGTLGNVAVHRLAFYDGSWRDTSYNMTVGTWYNITFTYDGTNVKLYVDNSEKFSGTLGGRDQSGNMYIGVRWEVNEGINGIIDDVKVYDHALTVAQIENLTAGSDDPDTPPDETAPTISSIATSTTSTGATVTWTTNEAASTKVVYSVGTTYASTTAEADTSTRVTSHSQALSNLLSCTLYNFKVVSRDAANNAATSTAQTFTTTGCSGGATPTSATSTTVTVSAAATTTSTDSGRTIKVGTPANFTATSSSVVIQIKGLSSDTVLGSVGKPSSTLTSAASVVFNVTALVDNSTELDSFDSPVTVSYTYTDADVSGLNESTLTMYHYADSAWSALDDCSVDTGTNTITCEAPHFSIFAIFGTTAASSAETPTGGISGTTIQGQVRNLIAVGNIARALALIWQYPRAFGLQIATASTATACPSYRFTRNLQFGSKGEDVRALQKFLNCQGLKLADTGPGSPGNETTLFAEKTRDAVIRFQEKYALEVLVPGGFAHGTGIFGTYSRAKAEGLMLP